ncbi:hypothetical protein [Shimazuella kribbensis]|uniref:hypothetical protein n=1 Tax=Shimazuella kribbensis TaxID=139808 RepID=UPI000404FD6B|nr:hypothetical protein [Shimazuella kribbensis]
MIKKEVAHRLIDQLFEIRETFQEKSKTQKHFQQAKKEGLLGLQSLIAHMIQKIEKNEKKQSQQVHQEKKIDIEY